MCLQLVHFYTPYPHSHGVLHQVDTTGTRLDQKECVIVLAVEEEMCFTHLDEHNLSHVDPDYAWSYLCPRYAANQKNYFACLLQTSTSCELAAQA